MVFYRIDKNIIRDNLYIVKCLARQGLAGGKTLPAARGSFFAAIRPGV